MQPHRSSAVVLALLASLSGFAQAAARPIGTDDIVRITVFQNPDMTVETRVGETGKVSYPLLGSVAIGGLAVDEAEEKIAGLLREGKFVRSAQVNVRVIDPRSTMVSVLGQVGKPGRYALETTTTTVSELIASAGGVVAGAADTVTLKGIRAGKPVRWTVDLPAILQLGSDGEDPVVERGDVLYVDRAPLAYIYGEVQRPGAFRLERGMTLMQAIAVGGGLTSRGTERGIRISRRDARGQLKLVELLLTDTLERDDVVYVRESVF